MKESKKRICHLLTLLASLAFVGCASSRETVSKPSGAGYGTVEVTNNRDLAHTYRRTELRYWNTSGKDTLIWSYLSNQIVYIGNDEAIFHGWLTTGSSDPDGPGRRKSERLFAVQGNGPAVDITDDIILLWAKASGTNAVDALRKAYVASLSKRTNTIEIEVAVMFGGWGTVELSQDQLNKIILQAKQTGKEMEDPGFGTPYLKRDWKLDLDKRK
jgi:hypothetical protein